MSQSITVEIADHIATVTLEKTTMPPAFFGACEAVFRELSQNDDLRAVVVRASGKAFSYGLDLTAAFSEMGDAFGGGLAAKRTKLLKLVRQLQGSFNAIDECPVPVIAAVHGRCIGGGLDLISACDIRLASADALISLRETKIAIVADLGSLQRLIGLVGRGHVREMAFTGGDVTAERAAAIGLVNHVYADKDAVHIAAASLAAEIAANAPLTVRGVKDVLRYSEGKSVADGLDYVAAWNSAFLASEDLGEAVAAFAQKRAPEFKGK